MTPRELVLYAQAFLQRRRVGRFGLGEELLDLQFDLAELRDGPLKIAFLLPEIRQPLGLSQIFGR